MAAHRLGLAILEGRLAVCRLGPDDPIPRWADLGRFASATGTPDELSIVCDESAVPDGVPAARGWVGLRVAGVLDFALVGVLASLALPLAEAGVSVFAVSTFDTDYLLVREREVGRAIAALEAAGHAFSG